jgi:hypothetical protein
MFAQAKTCGFRLTAENCENKRLGKVRTMFKDRKSSPLCWSSGYLLGMPAGMHLFGALCKNTLIQDLNFCFWRKKPDLFTNLSHRLLHQNCLFPTFEPISAILLQKLLDCSRLPHQRQDLRAARIQHLSSSLRTLSLQHTG